MKEKKEKLRKKSPLNLHLPVEDKTFLKIYALEHETTVSALIHEYAEELRKKSKKEVQV